MENVPNSQKNFVSLHQENNKNNAYDTSIDRGTDNAVQKHDNADGDERLGLHSRAKRGRPTLGNRWDTLPYEEGLWTVEAGDKLGSPKPTVRQESKRLIEVAKAVGDYIPSTVWETYGKKVETPTAESVVFTDEKNNRVVKFKDPFVVCFKDDFHLDALYLHHVHNRFFGNSEYRFLGVSKDPNVGGVRLVFEQPFINSILRPTKEDVVRWFTDRGFHLSDNGFFYTDGYVSFTDVVDRQDSDNCIKDKDGNLYFIDPMIVLDKPAKEIIAHYQEMDKALDAELDEAGIGVGSRFRCEHMNSLNDVEVKMIDYGGQRLVFGPLPSNTHPDYQRIFDLPISSVLDKIKLKYGMPWVQTDENRKDIVIPAARKALVERAKDPSPRAAFTDDQLKAINRFCTLYSDSTSKEFVYQRLLDFTKSDFKEARLPDAWVDDVRDELMSLAHGERREMTESIRR